MALDSEFSVMYLEDIERTLSELIEPLKMSKLRINLEFVQSRLTALRMSIETSRKTGELDSLIQRKTTD